MKTYDERSKDVTARIARHKKQRRIITGTCLTMAVVLLAAFLFVPYNTNPPSVSQYASSPYYDLIRRINDATYVPPVAGNNFESIAMALDSLGRKFMFSGSDAVMDDAENINGGWYDSAEGQNDLAYVEVTDNQVAGVIESDIIKRSTEYIYYLRDAELSVYSIAGEDSCLISTYKIADALQQENIDKWGGFSYYDSVEMYLSSDCAALTLVMDAYFKSVGSCTVLVSLDVTDPEKITETERVYLSGDYLSSRMVGGDILLMNKFRISSDYQFNDESTFLPQVGQPGNMKSVAAEDILYPEELTSTQYTVICKLDGSTLEVQDTAAFLSYSDEIYVSAENIFATRSYSENTNDGGSRSLTEISCLSYGGDTLENRGSATVEGSVKDQYSMDEYEGILRVVTSISNTLVTEDGQFASARWERNASLFCISLEDFSIIAAVEKFAPEGEQAESVRFDGVNAYVCTAEVITLTDPVYFFDLSDPENITYTDTGTIDGYSSSLVNLGEGYLLGIGYGGSWNLKIEIYEELEDKVVSVCAYNADATFSEVYKSYLVDRENDLIGLGIRDWNDGISKYVLLHFDGYDLNEITEIPMEGSLADMRAVLIDGWLYVFGDTFAVEQVL